MDERSPRVPTVVVLAAMGVLIYVAERVGSSDWVGRVLLGSPPLVGDWDPAFTTRALAPISLALVLVAVAPLATERLRFGTLTLAAWASAALFTTTVAATAGRSAISAPLATRYEYRAVLPEIERAGVGRFIRDFTVDLPGYPTHVRGHPVGASLVFWLQERVGLVGVAWSAALVIVVGASAVVSVAFTMRHVVGEEAARRAVPFLVLVPAVVWMGTSMDGLLAGVIAAAIALMVVAATGTSTRHDLAGLAGGALGALALHVSYGAVVMLLPALVVVVSRRRVRPLLVAAVGAVVVTAGFVALGFWWFDGLAATRVEYLKGAGSYRPYWYFTVLANPAALTIAVGPAVVVALSRLRDRRAWLLAGSALAGVVLADVSGMSKGEVERIWLPFVPWLATAAMVFRPPSRRWWLATQATFTIALQLCLVSPW